MALLATLKQRALLLGADALALLLAARDPATPWRVRVWLGLIVVYVLDPLDLIPDFIPLLGYVDEFVLVPMAVGHAIKMIPPAVLARSRGQAGTLAATAARLGRIALACILTLWLLALALAVYWIAG